MSNSIDPSPRPQISPATAKQRDDIAATAQEFEGVFLGQMAKLMLESVELGSEFSGGHAEETFRGILAEKLGTQMASHGGIGLAPAVMEQMIKMQEGSQ